MSQLEALFTQYGTDKGIWGYTPAYQKHLSQFRIKNVLEIGICGFRDIPGNVVGASLFAWRDYFPEAEVYGVDNDARFIFNDQPRIHTYLCDAYAERSLADALHEFRWPQFDFICDDAVHDPLPQIHLCRLLWPMLRPGGVYAIEESCPYKCPGGTLKPMVDVLLSLYSEMQVTEYQTHKAERLLILEKPSNDPQPGLNWQLSEETKARLAELDRAVIRPGDPRLNTIICGGGDK